MQRVQGAHDSCRVHITVAGPQQGGDRRSPGAPFASVHFGLLLAAFKTARLWGRVRELRFACERWMGPVRA
jgi:hypothetical protein